MARLSRSSELELDFLIVDQVGQVVRWCDQAVRFSVADIHPPLRTKMEYGHECIKDVKML